MCMLLQMNYQHKQLIGAMIVAGWDKENGGQVYGCPIGGTLVQGKLDNRWIWQHLHLGIPRLFFQVNQLASACQHHKALMHD